MRTTTFMIAAALTLAGAARADVYKCTVGRKVIYQNAACAAGTEKVLDDRQRQARLKAESDKKRWEEELKARKVMEEQTFKKSTEEIRRRVDAVVACSGKNQSCSITDYQRNLKCLPIGYVHDALGKPVKSQSIGGDDIHYYVVLANGTRTTLQLVMGYCSDLPLPGGGNSRVTRVNAY